MIQNGRPLTHTQGHYDARLIDELAQEDQDKLIKWIKENVYPRKDNDFLGITSAKLKYIISQETGIRMTNNQCKDIMLQCGFEPVDNTELYWRYFLDKSSPIFQE